MVEREKRVILLCLSSRAVGRGGGSNFVHFLYKVLGQRSVQNEPF